VYLAFFTHGGTGSRLAFLPHAVEHAAAGAARSGGEMLAAAFGHDSSLLSRTYGPADREALYIERRSIGDDSR
jgi:hypothetical protein